MFSAATKSAKVASAANYIESVFSTYLYTGNGATQSINNGIDLSTQGGMTWLKARDVSASNYLFDTARGRAYSIRSSAAGQATSGSTNDLTSFNTNGFSLGVSSQTYTNVNASTFASWTFRKQPKFFDVVTYTGNGTTQNIAHNLGSAPGCIFVKKTSGATDWLVYHRSLTSGYFLRLNTTAAQASGASNVWGDNSSVVDPTSTVFTVGNEGNVNGNGDSFVAYLFAHNAGGFGLTGTDNVISCGSFTADGSGNATVNLGYEPQWVMIKKSSTTGSWDMIDNMRGWPVDSAQKILDANLSDAEFSSNRFPITSTGFASFLNAASTTYIYIAIRRGPMKVPTDGTTVFSPVTRTGTGANATVNASILTDTTFIMDRSPTWQAAKVFDRLRGATNLVYSNTTSAEVSDATTLTSFANMTGYVLGDDSSNYDVNRSASSYINWNFKRAPSFFDEVCYTGAGATSYSHNLGAVPELIIVKCRSNAVGAGWAVYSATLGASKYLKLQGTDAAITDSGPFGTTPTSTVFYGGGDFPTSYSGYTYVAYLFATCSGVSKVGSYTGTGATQTISCGFTGGARLVLIKRTDSTGNWEIFDTARGMVAGTDPHLELNTTNAETNANWVYTTTGGFQIVTSDANVNASGGSYIFLAVS